MTPAKDVTLKWPTFTDAADQAGISRRFGGIHFEQGDLDGRETGRLVARLCWDRAQALFEGDLRPHVLSTFGNDICHPPT